jgi:anti-sigma factor RsiW
MQLDNWTPRLSEYIDGELSPGEAEALEAHLLECDECGRILQDLRGVVARAANVLDRPPENDLWQGIAARIAPEQTPAQKRRFSFSVSQLAAASIVLMMLSAGSMYLILTRTQSPQIAAEPAAQVPAPATEPVTQVAASAEQPDAQAPTSTAPVTTDKPVARQVHAETPATRNYDLAIQDLEGALRSGRSRLDTATVRVLESNLRTIDGAIAEARAALGRDPGNPYLNRYLDQTMQKKIQLLRRATRIVRAQT